MLAGLGHAEERGIAHRDLKPENVLHHPPRRRQDRRLRDRPRLRRRDGPADPHGDGDRDPRLHGARAGAERAASARTRTSTRSASSPTSCWPAARRSRADDAGRRALRHVHEPPPPLAEVAPDAPLAVREWVDWLLAKAPAERPGRPWRPGRRSRRSSWPGSGPTGGAPPPSRRRARSSAAAGRARGHGDRPRHDRRLAAGDRYARGSAQAARPSGAAPAAAHGRGRRRRRGGDRRDGIARLRRPTTRSNRRRPRRAAPRRRFDFDGDGRQELGARPAESSPREADDTSGVVIVPRGPAPGLRR